MFPQPWVEVGGASSTQPEQEIHQLRSKHPDTQGHLGNNGMIIPVLILPYLSLRQGTQAGQVKMLLAS